MDTTTVETMRVFDSLVKGRGTAKEAAIRAIDNKNASIDREQLRILILHSLVHNFPPPKTAQEDDFLASDTRCWLLSALARLSGNNKESAKRVRSHLNFEWEPYEWARYWTLEGLISAQASDLVDIAKQLVTTEKAPLVCSLATAILASKGDGRSLTKIKQQLEGEYEERWAMLRALRIVPIPEMAIVRQLCTLVENGAYSDLTFDAIVALGKLPPHSQQAETASQILSNYLIKYRWPMYDSMRTKALSGLGNLGVERTASVLIEELSDDSPAIMYAAARALEKVLGVRTATIRLMEAAAKSGPDSLPKFANALRSMNRTTVVEELESILLTGSETQQEIARTILSEVGGLHAFQILRARTNAANRYIEVLEQAEAKVRELFEASILEARQGFKLAMVMDVFVFLIGLALVIGSAGRILFSGGSLDSWAGVGLTGGIGVLGVLYGILISNPRRQVKESVDHLMHLKVVFLAYLRQLHQTDQAYTRRLLEERTFPATEVAEFSKMVGTTMAETVLNLSHAKNSTKQNETANQTT